jgi:hypothetical protein
MRTETGGMEFHTRYSSDTGSVGELGKLSSIFSAQMLRGPDVLVSYDEGFLAFHLTSKMILHISVGSMRLLPAVFDNRNPRRRRSVTWY